MKIVEVAFEERHKKKYKYYTDLDLVVGDIVVTPTGPALVIGVDVKASNASYEMKMIERKIGHLAGGNETRADLFRCTETPSGAIRIKMVSKIQKFGEIIIPSFGGKPLILSTDGFNKRTRKLEIPENVILIEEDAFGVEINQVVINCKKSFDVIKDSEIRSHVIYEYIKDSKNDELPMEYINEIRNDPFLYIKYFRLKKLKDIVISKKVIDEEYITKLVNYIDSQYPDLDSVSDFYKSFISFIVKNYYYYSKNNKEILNKLYELIFTIYKYKHELDDNSYEKDCYSYCLKNLIDNDDPLYAKVSDGLKDYIASNNLI